MKAPYRCPDPDSLGTLIGEAFEAMPGPDTIRLGKIGARLEAGLRRRRWHEFLARWWWVGLLAGGGAAAAWWASREPAGFLEPNEIAAPVVIPGNEGGAAVEAEPSGPEITTDASTPPEAAPAERPSPIIDRRERY